MSNKTEAAFHGRTLQDELRAAAPESEDYNLLTRAADALDRAERDHLEAWETEDEDAVVWGTHDAEKAHAVFRDFYEQNGSEPYMYPTVEQWRDEALTKWARPELRYLEVWPKDGHGNRPVEGWIPYLVLGQ